MHRADVHAPYEYQTFVDSYVNGLDLNSATMRHAAGRTGRAGRSQESYSFELEKLACFVHGIRFCFKMDWPEPGHRRVIMVRYSIAAFCVSMPTCFMRSCAD